ncbi:hypothetical protein ACPA54_18270 [Uniformispora flossi]|uniref:hypothetical protein n=1 Tax=Uniformispora flossi TaxID=3390723 RepID=UPI003C2D3EB0
MDAVVGAQLGAEPVDAVGVGGIAALADADEEVGAEQHDVAAFEERAAGVGDAVEGDGAARRDDGVPGAAGDEVGDEGAEPVALLEAVREAQRRLDHGVADDDHRVADEDLEGDRGELGEEGLFVGREFDRAVDGDAARGQEVREGVELRGAAREAVRVRLGPALAGEVGGAADEACREEAEGAVPGGQCRREGEVEGAADDDLGETVPLPVDPDGRGGGGREGGGRKGRRGGRSRGGGSGHGVPCGGGGEAGERTATGSSSLGAQGHT